MDLMIRRLFRLCIEGRCGACDHANDQRLDGRVVERFGVDIGNVPAARAGVFQEAFRIVRVAPLRK
jgi:hypothetical protein